MAALKIRLPDTRRDVLLLEPGVHALTPALMGAAQGDDVLANIFVDTRGVWLHVRDGLRGAYVNGRPIRSMAMLRAGDSLFLHGHEVLVMGREPEPVPPEMPDGPQRGPVRCVLRAVGGPLHGRCFALNQGVTMGSVAECAVRIDDARIGPRHVELVPTSDAIVATAANAAAAFCVNGHRVTSARLLPGDQLVLAGTHRFVLEAPRPYGLQVERGAEEKPAAPTVQRAPIRLRVPWLLVAAVLLAAALTALLLYGAR